MGTETQGRVLSRKELLEIYDDVGPFSEGLAWAQKNNQCCHIYPDGTPAYKERYTHVGNFFKGVVWVSKGNEGFHIRPDGTRAD